VIFSAYAERNHAKIACTPYDAEGAAKAGIRSVGVRCGGWTEDALKQAGCEAVYADAADLLANYESSLLGRR
jgi:phosphoglycolate phosphatase-like HAD superfamily hydrolase